VIGDARAPGAPPVDSLAECVVLWRLMRRPEQIDAYDVGPLLNFPEHRWIWAAMLRVHAAEPHADADAFFGLWLADIQQHHPEHWWNLVDLIFHKDEAARSCEEAYRDDPPGMVRWTAHYHTFDWWFARLKAIKEARDGIRAAQRIAERYWQMPDHAFSGAEAAAILEQFVPPQRPTLADRVLHL
jgi:hypothetical protein